MLSRCPRAPLVNSSPSTRGKPGTQKRIRSHGNLTPLSKTPRCVNTSPPEIGAMIHTTAANTAPQPQRNGQSHEPRPTTRRAPHPTHLHPYSSRHGNPPNEPSRKGAMNNTAQHATRHPDPPSSTSPQPNTDRQPTPAQSPAAHPVQNNPLPSNSKSTG